MSGYKWRREDVRKLIKMVKKRVCLWDVKHQHYHSLVNRRIALEEIKTELDIPIEEIKKKLHILRTQFTKERTKMRMVHSSNGTEKTYKTKWEFFDLLQFMFQNTQKPAKQDSVIGETVIIKSGEDDVDINIDNQLLTEHFLHQQQPTDEEPSCQSTEELSIPLNDLLSIESGSEILSTTKSVRRPISRKRKTSESSVETQNQPGLNRYGAILSQIKPNDQFSIFGEHVANELRLLSKLPDIQLKLKYDIQQLIANANYESFTRQFGTSTSTSQNTHTSLHSSESSKHILGI